MYLNHIDWISTVLQIYVLHHIYSTIKILQIYTHCIDQTRKIPQIYLYHIECPHEIQQTHLYHIDYISDIPQTYLVHIDKICKIQKHKFISRELHQHNSTCIIKSHLLYQQSAMIPHTYLNHTDYISKMKYIIVFSYVQISDGDWAPLVPKTYIGLKSWISNHMYCISLQPSNIVMLLLVYSYRIHIAGI